MLYVLFMLLAILYNLKKFRKEREFFLSSLIEAKSVAHREMILGHHFYIFIFEGFLALIVAHLITERAMAIGIVGLGMAYLTLFFLGLYLYQFFIRYIEKNTGLELFRSFRTHLIKELRVNFAIVIMPILIYSLINWAFQDGVYEEWGSLWFLGLFLNIIFVSVLTIACSVILMLRLIPNREIIEPEYLDVINKRLAQIGQPNMRIRWIETDIKNAFVVGMKLLKLSNQTMFIGRSLRTTLSIEEFDAVIAHELAHVANRHIHKRVIDLLKNLISVVIGMGTIMLLVFGLTFLYWGEDAYLYTGATTFWCVVLCMAWMFFNYTILFDTLRSHEYEADGYAVIEMGASLVALKGVLQKLNTTEEIPEYLRARTKLKTKKTWFARLFSTHPEASERISFLEYKIAAGLPFNYYVSTPQRVKRWMGHLLHWKIAAPASLAFIAGIFHLSLQVKTGQEDIQFVTSAGTREIIANPGILKRINSRPQLVGQSLMFFVVMKRDETLIEYFLERGADRGKTLMYISQLKDYGLLQKYFERFKDQLTDDDYFLILRKTAQVNFTEGYRLLVNAKRFEDLNPAYKEDVSRLHRSNRAPASEK